MSAVPQTIDRLRPKPVLDQQFVGLDGAWIKRLREMPAGEQRAVDGGLKIEAVMDVTQQHSQRPLVLLVATRRSHCEEGFAVARDERRRQRRSRPCVGPHGGGKARFEPAHLSARRDREAELGHRGRALQPAAGWCRCKKVSEAIHHVEMHSVAPLDRQRRKRRLAITETNRFLRARHRKHALHAVGSAGKVSRPHHRRSLIGDQLAACRGIFVGEQRRERHVDEVRIAVEHLAVGVAELQAFDDRMHEGVARGVHRIEVEAFEHGEHLQHHGALAPRSGLVHAKAAIEPRHRRFDCRAVARHVVGRQQAPVAAAGRVDQRVRTVEAVDRFCDEAAIVSVARLLDLSLAVRTDRLRLLHDPAIGRCNSRRAQQRPRARHLAIRQPHRGGGRPFGLEEILRGENGRRDAGQNRKSILGVTDRRLQNVGKLPGAVVAQHQHPGVERAGHDARQHAGAGHLLAAQRGKSLKRRSRGVGPLAADHDRLGRVMLLQDDRHLAARPDQMRLDDLEHKPRSRRSIEGIAATLQHRHRDRACDPMRACDGAKSAAYFRPGGEALLHGNSVNAGRKLYAAGRNLTNSPHVVKIIREGAR